MAPKAEIHQLIDLQDRWKDMFQRQLPAAATSKSEAQPRWPVHVDHCFARIILDSVVGKGQDPWMKRIKSPAYKNMTRPQLEQAIEMGQDILSGEIDLVELDEQSLSIRGKLSKGKTTSTGKKSGKLSPKTQRSLQAYAFKNEAGTPNLEEENKRQSEQKEEESDGEPETQRKRKAKGDDEDKKEGEQKNESKNSRPSKRKHSHTSPPPSSPASKRATTAPRTLIDRSNKTAFQKRVLSLLLQIPAGHFTTYALLATHLGSSARAVGSAIRNNPFAPQVPCHRVLATGGGIGGFGGSWGRRGEVGANDEAKRDLLRAEGVRFDGRGKAVGSPWSKFKELEQAGRQDDGEER